ncbi:hypothetical protein DFO61_2061 [Ectopseudomonas oleovorans]|uniref:Uncharacterized protein n=1 Tax=Ectopseudomonas oleovorans TaxID=301 RepID=A0A397N9Z7_ECTOL|nr:hypothetical protein DFO61_2061 [Pseudomonas oleovorans]
MRTADIAVSVEAVSRVGRAALRFSRQGPPLSVG